METDGERRAARRFSMALPLKVRFPDGETFGEKQGHTRDVSFRGLYFTIEAPLEAGSSIEFVLTLPQQITLAGDVHIRCYARVLRVETKMPAAALLHASSGTNFCPLQPDCFGLSLLQSFSSIPESGSGKIRFVDSRRLKQDLREGSAHAPPHAARRRR